MCKINMASKTDTRDQILKEKLLEFKEIKDEIKHYKDHFKSNKQEIAKA